MVSPLAELKAELYGEKPLGLVSLTTGFTAAAALGALFRNENLATSGKVAPADESPAGRLRG
jgi:hypothetical protein